MRDLYQDIDVFLTVERKFKTMEDDVFLHNFALGYRGASDNWSVSEAQYKEYLALERQEKQTKAYRYQWGGIMFTDEGGNVTIRYGQASMLIPAERWSQFLQDAFSQHPGPHAGGPSTAFPGQSSAPVNVGGNHLENTDNPLLKERMNRSLNEMERWAEASSSRYPKNT